MLESHKEQEGMFTVKTSLPWKTAVFKNILNVSTFDLIVYVFDEFFLTGKYFKFLTFTFYL